MQGKIEEGNLGTVPNVYGVLENDGEVLGSLRKTNGSFQLKTEYFRLFGGD